MSAGSELVRRGEQRLAADPTRVVTRLFVPGQEGFEHEDSRAALVLRRLFAWDDEEAQAALDDVCRRFEHRHRDVRAIFARHADEVAGELADVLGPDATLTEAQRLLVGATFTKEYSVEGAALCNPSMVAHPDQSGVDAGGLRVVMSARAVGEGHRSSVVFRTGMVDAGGGVTIDRPPPLATTGEVGPAPLDAAVLRAELYRLDTGTTNADFVLEGLDDRFGLADLEVRLHRLGNRPITRRHGGQTALLARAVAERFYETVFAEDTSLAERVLWPATAAESHGLEDARFVRFTDDDGSAVYLATYTAYDGTEICEQLLETTDFLTFTSSPIVGQAAANKGLALFPRKVGGRYAALSRWDRESNAVAFSDNLRCWGEATRVQAPVRPWEVIQLGNCGSPIETDAGWLVLTHGVGPMRTYGIGALVLDLDDPTTVVAQLREPLLLPSDAERDGYVPNVVYSCGALLHSGTIVIPYGISDAAIGVATVELTELLDAMQTT